MKFLLCADLHIKEAEKEYSFSVLDEVISLCEKSKCEALLFAGDVFDSSGDVEALHAGFRSALEKLSCDVYFLPGNHEELRAGAAFSLERYNFGKARLLNKKPFSLHYLDTQTELLAVPFQRDYYGYRDWNVPPKKSALRIMLAHGVVPGIAYTGPGEETDSVIDEDIFTHFNADIAALGHLHGCSVNQKGNTLAVYPGSARVWREGEEGKRYVLLGNTEHSPVFSKIVLASAGEYRVVPVSVTPEGELGGIPEDFSPNDWMLLDAAGVVEDESPVIGALEKLKSELEKKYRAVSYSTKNLSVLAGVSTHPLALRFLKAWKDAAASHKDEESGVYETARLQGLLSLKKILEKRK